MTGDALHQPSAAARRLSSVGKHAGSVEDYTSLPYHFLLVRDGEDKGKPWTASVEELPGCTSHGKTSDEALDGIEAAMAKWIAVALEEGREIPEPKSATSHSGRLLLRMPRIPSSLRTLRERLYAKKAVHTSQTLYEANFMCIITIICTHML
jgi:antitoxin HicB